MDVDKSSLNHMKVVEDDDSGGCAERKKPKPKPRISLLKKQSTEGVQSASDVVDPHTCDTCVSTESSGSRSLTRTNSYQTAVDGFLADLIATETSAENDFVDNNSVSVIGVEVETLTTDSTDAGFSVSSECLQNVINSDKEKETASNLSRSREPPPLPARNPVGQLNACKAGLDEQPVVTIPDGCDPKGDSQSCHGVERDTKKSLSPPKTAPKPSKQRTQELKLKLHRQEISAVKIPASISTPNISHYQQPALDNTALGDQRAEYHQSAVDIKDKKLSDHLTRSVSSTESKDRSKKGEKKQERRRSSQFYFNLDGEEEVATDGKSVTRWWSFGKGGKKRGAKKNKEISSVFYCGVNEGGTLKFNDTKQVGLQDNQEVMESHDERISGAEVIEPGSCQHQASDAGGGGGGGHAPAVLRKGKCLNENVLEEYIKKYINESENIRPKPPPRPKRKSHLLEMQQNSLYSLTLSQEDEVSKHSNFGQVTIKQSNHDICNSDNGGSGSTAGPESAGNGADLDTQHMEVEPKYEMNSSNNQRWSAERDGEDNEAQCDRVEDGAPSVLIQSEDSDELQKQDEDTKAVVGSEKTSLQIVSPLEDSPDNIYLPMSRDDTNQNPHHSCFTSRSSESSDDYVPMITHATEDGSGLLRCDVDCNMRPSSWAGPDSDDIEYDGKLDQVDLFNLPHNSSSDEVDDADVEAEQDMIDTLQNLADMKEKLNRKKMKAFYAAKEIMTSEENFVQVLKLLNEDFRQHVLSAKGPLGGPIIPTKEMDQILKYLPLLQKFSEELLKDLKIRIDNWDNSQKIADVFIEKGPFLKMYTDYIREFETLCTCLDEARKRFPEFDKAVAQFEDSSKCSHMAVKHFMLKPVQRIPQYRLLLNEYRKYLEEDCEDYQDSKTALDIVSEVADHANKSMALGTNIKKLIEIQNSLIGDFEVVKPGRLLVRSGILKKLCRKEMQSRMFFLFSDTLVCTTPLTSGYRFKTNLSLDGMKVSKPSKEDFANEFSIISTIRSFRLSASTSEERDEWLKTLQNTISDYRQKKFSYLLQTNKCHRNTTGCDALFQNDVDFKLGKQAPVWVPDSRVSMCAKCHEEFTVTFRRHHCRACGKVFCGVCSDNRAPLCYQNYKPGRVCIDCFNYLKAEASILVRNVQHTEHTRQMMDSMKVFFQTFSHGSSHGRDSMWSSFGKGKRKRSSLLQEVKAATEDADTSGYMEIWENKRWKKMWFVLKNKVLYFYRASEDTAAVKSIVLIGFEVQTFGEPFQKVDPSLIFQVIHKNVQPLTFKTENESSRDRWLKYMKQAVIP